MDRLTDDERERLREMYVQELVALGYDKPDAHFAVALYFGETRGDVVADPPLTKEEYRRMGLNRDFLFEVHPELETRANEIVRRRRTGSAATAEAAAPTKEKSG